MNIKLIIFVAILAALGLLLFFTGKEVEVVEEHDHSQHQPMQMEQAPATGTDIPTFERVTITVQNIAEEEFGPIELTANTFVDLPGTKFKLRATEFYTHWNWNMKAINLSKAEQNPAVKVEVYSGDDLLHHGWGFRNLPFFRMGQKGAHGEVGSAEQEQLAFTLISYEGVKFAE